MTDLRQAAHQALEMLEELWHLGLEDTSETQHKAAIDNLRAALAEPEQNPFRDDAERYARKLHEEREYYKALFTEHKPQTTHWEGCEAVHFECKTELERKSNAIQRLWKERDELRALNAELVEALRGLSDEVEHFGLHHPDGNSNWWPVALEKAQAALAKVASNGS